MALNIRKNSAEPKEPKASKTKEPKAKKVKTSKEAPTFNESQLYPPLSAFNFNQEADDVAAAKIPGAQKLLTVAAAFFALSAGFTYLGTSAKSGATDRVDAERISLAQTGSQINSLIGADRRLPDHVNSRLDELAIALQGSTDTAALWSALQETVPSGVTVTSADVTKNTPDAEGGETAAGTRTVFVTAIVTSGIQIVEWNAVLSASESFSVAGEGVTSSGNGAVSVYLQVAPGVFQTTTDDTIGLTMSSDEAPTSEAEVPAIDSGSEVSE